MIGGCLIRHHSQYQGTWVSDGSCEWNVCFQNSRSLAVGPQGFWLPQTLPVVRRNKYDYPVTILNKQVLHRNKYDFLSTIRNTQDCDLDQPSSRIQYVIFHAVGINTDMASLLEADLNNSQWSIRLESQ